MAGHAIDLSESDGNSEWAQNPYAKQLILGGLLAKDARLEPDPSWRSHLINANGIVYRENIVSLGNVGYDSRKVDTSPSQKAANRNRQTSPSR
jgi:hypothetical protein